MNDEMENTENTRKPSLIARMVKGIFKLLFKIISAIIIYIFRNFWEVLRPLFGWLVDIVRREFSVHPAGTTSLTLHLLLIAMLIFGLPDIFHEKPPEEIHFVPVEMLPIKDKTNVKPEEPKEEQQVKKEEPKEPVKKVYSKPEPTPPEPEPEKEKVNLAEKQKEEIALKEKIKKAEEKAKEEAKKKEAEKKAKEAKELEKKKKADLDFDSVLRSVEKLKDNLPKKAATPAAAPYDPTKPLSMSEIDAIKRQIQGCWSIPAGARDAEDIVVVLSINLSQDGTAQSVKIVDQSKYQGDNFFRAAADSAVRAVYKCSPLKGLPMDKYSSWKEIELKFNPRELL